MLMETSPRPRRETKRGRRAEIDTSVPSPCISLCQISKSENICLGCKRTIDEIRDWMVMSADEKRAVHARLDALK